MKKRTDIILFTTLYPKALQNSQRLFELKKALQFNLENPFIIEIVIFFQRETEDFNPFKNGFEFLQNPKIQIHFLTNQPIKRPTFKNLIEYANEHYPNKHIVICNSDIFFTQDSQIQRLTELENHNEIWFLTRYYYRKKINAWVLNPFGKPLESEEKEDLPDFQNWKIIADLEEYRNLGKKLSKNQCQMENHLAVGSADSFCFYAPLRQTDFDIFLGTENCDHYFMMKAYFENLKVLSPSLSIFSRHLQHSEKRNYDDINYSTQNKDGKYSIYYTARNCTLENPYYLKVSNFFIIRIKYFIWVQIRWIAKKLNSFPFFYEFGRKIYNKMFLFLQKK